MTMNTELMSKVARDVVADRVDEAMQLRTERRLRGTARQRWAARLHRLADRIEQKPRATAFPLTH